VKTIRTVLSKLVSRLLIQKQENLGHFEKKMGQMTVEDESSKKPSTLQIDNIYDMLFDGMGRPKEEHMQDRLQFTGTQFDFLDQEGRNIETKTMATKAVDVEKLKLSKVLKLVDPVPKFQSVPATPQFFDLASSYVEYPSLAESIERHKVQKGLFGAISGFFGR